MTLGAGKPNIERRLEDDALHVAPEVLLAEGGLPLEPVDATVQAGLARRVDLLEVGPVELVLQVVAEVGGLARQSCGLKRYVREELKCYSVPHCESAEKCHYHVPAAAAAALC